MANRQVEEQGGRLSVGLEDPAALAQKVRDGKHWIVLFGRDDNARIDELHRFVDVWPSFPTYVGPVTMTVIPKSALSVRRFRNWCAKRGGQGPRDSTTDIICITRDIREAQAMLIWPQRQVESSGDGELYG